MTRLSAVSDTTPRPARLVVCQPCVDHYAGSKAAEYGHAIVAYAQASGQSPLELAERYRAGVHRQHANVTTLTRLEGHL